MAQPERSRQSRQKPIGGRSIDIGQQEHGIADGPHPVVPERPTVPTQERERQQLQKSQQERCGEQQPQSSAPSHLDRKPASAGAQSRETQPGPGQPQKPVQESRFGKPREQRVGDRHGDPDPAAGSGNGGAGAGPFDAEQQQRQKRDWHDRGVGKPGKGAVQLEQQPGRQCRGAANAELAGEREHRQPRHGLHGDLQIQHAGEEPQQQHEGQKEGGGGHGAGQRQPDAGIRVPPRHRPVQPVPCRQAAQRLRGDAGIAVHPARISGQQPARPARTRQAGGGKNRIFREPAGQGRPVDQNRHEQQQQRAQQCPSVPPVRRGHRPGFNT